MVDDVGTERLVLRRLLVHGGKKGMGNGRRRIRLFPLIWRSLLWVGGQVTKVRGAGTKGSEKGGKEGAILTSIQN